MTQHADRLRRSASIMANLVQAAADEIERLERHEPRKPITDERLRELIAEYPSNRMLLARAIEREHDITEADRDD